MEKNSFINELKIRCVNVSDEQYALLDKFMKHVLLTNEKFNLTAIKNESEFLEKMVFDSAILLNDQDLKNASILDMGTGAGFPSVVLAILSNNKVTALDSTKKKIDFIADFCRENNIKIDCVNARAEEFSSNIREKYDYVTARAMAELRILVELGVPALKVGGKLLAYKGPNYEEEVERSRGTMCKLGCHIEKVYSDVLPKTGEERNIIYIVKDRVTDKKFPREYKIIINDTIGITMAKIISICNQKGGVGKTTSAINISAALAHNGRRVLLVDMDPQGNASQGVGFDISLLSKCVLDVLNDGQSIKKVIKKTNFENLDLLPSKLKLASMDDLDSSSNKYHILKDCLMKIEDQYDYIIIDCPPSFGFLTLNSLVASNTVIIPVQCEYFAMAAISQMLATISRIQSSLNPSLSIEGFLLTMYDAKTNMDTDITIQVRSLFKENTFLTQIPRNISIPESNQRGEPVTSYRPTSSGALAYFSLAKEIIDHETF